MQKQVMANWKMHGRGAWMQTLLAPLVAQVSADVAARCVIFPPFVYLSAVREALGDSPWFVGAQNVCSQEEGAYTGEVSAAMLHEVGCRYVLVGHSERRQLFAENEKFVAEKFHRVKEHAMIPVLCLGETLYERDHNKTEDVLKKQLAAVMAVSDFSRSVIAYEPVWAIGSGHAASPAEVEDVHGFIRSWLVEAWGSTEPVPILYGGSVTGKNASTYLDLPDVDGCLVGGASLNVESFLDILACII